MKDLVARAIHQVAMKASNPGVQVSLFHFERRMAAKKLEIKSVLTQSDFSNAQVDFVPLSLRDIKLEKSDIAWSDIGGALTLYISAYPADLYFDIQVCLKLVEYYGKLWNGR